MAHTPGPWEARKHLGTQNGPFWGVWAKDERLTTLDATGPIDEANARLIAAAPELLAALERIVDDCGFIVSADDCECGENGNGFDDKGRPCEHIQACRAIAKAKGK